MSRQSTGRPRGRPVGRGAVLEREQIRLTVRLPATLYDRLEAYAESLHYTRGTPELASVVRAALEHWLTCPQRRQTKNIHNDNGDNNGQTENSIEHQPETPEQPYDNRWQTKNDILSIVENVEQTGHCTTPLEKYGTYEADGQTAVVAIGAQETTQIPGYDHTRYQLGPECKRGHLWPGTGLSLREIRKGKGIGDCVECHRQRARASVARRKATPGEISQSSGVNTRVADDIIDDIIMVVDGYWQ